MKTNVILSMMAAAAMTIGIFTSCEPVYHDDYYAPHPSGNESHYMDQDQSIAFAGQWTGRFGASYNFTWGGRTTTYYSDDTDIVFYPDFKGATYGWGKEVDFYAVGPYEYIYNRFVWKIRDGILYLTYDNDPGMDCWIRDYRMTNDFFSGYFGNTNNSFKLAKIVDLYDWTPYVNTYSYGERRDWYNVRGEVTDNDSSVVTSQPEAKIECFNRFAKEQ